MARALVDLNHRIGHEQTVVPKRGTSHWK